MSGLKQDKLHLLVLNKLVTKPSAHFQYLLEQAERHFQINHCFELFRKNTYVFARGHISQDLRIKDNIASTLKVH